MTLCVLSDGAERTSPRGLSAVVDKNQKNLYLNDKLKNTLASAIGVSHALCPLAA